MEPHRQQRGPSGTGEDGAINRPQILGSAYCHHVGKQAQCGSSLREALNFASSKCLQLITLKKKRQTGLSSQTKYTSWQDAFSSVPLFRSKINIVSQIVCSSETRFSKRHKLPDGYLALTAMEDGRLG